MVTLTPAFLSLVSPHCTTLILDLVISGICPLMASSIVLATRRWSSSFSAWGTKQSIVTSLISGMLLKVMSRSISGRLSWPLGPRSGLFLWYGELSSHDLRRCGMTFFGVPGGVCR